MGVALGARSAYADAGGPVEIAAECRVGPDQPKASHLNRPRPCPLPSSHLLSKSW